LITTSQIKPKLLHHLLSHNQQHHWLQLQGSYQRRARRFHLHFSLPSVLPALMQSTASNRMILRIMKMKLSIFEANDAFHSINDYSPSISQEDSGKEVCSSIVCFMWSWWTSSHARTFQHKLCFQHIIPIAKLSNFIIFDVFTLFFIYLSIS